MNRTNSGANTNTESLLLDILIVLLVFSVDTILFRQYLTPENIWSFTVLVFVFILIFVLSNRAAYLYNVTMFFYFDRVHRKISLSFFTAAVTDLLLLSIIGNSPFKREFFLIFFVSVYVLICVKMFLHTPIRNLIKKMVAPRTAFVGKVDEYNKFNYFLKKTSVSVQEIGYIAKSRAEFEKADEGKYIGCIEDLEEIVRNYNLDQIYMKFLK